MNTEVTTMTVNGVDYVRKDSVSPVEIEGDIKIVILQRGWNMIGRFERTGSDCKLHNASVIRIWGTTDGLGQLATKGKTSSTKLDKCGGVVAFDYLTVVATIDCSEEIWKKEL